MWGRFQAVREGGDAEACRAFFPLFHYSSQNPFFLNPRALDVTAMLSAMRRLLKRVHPEGIPWPGTVLYSAISQSAIFQRHYDLAVQDILAYGAEGRLLDIGTGPAWLLLRLCAASPRFRLVGLDASEPMVDKARQNVAAAGLSHVIEIKAGNVIDMPFTDGTFDTVVSTGSIHHWKEPVRGLNEVYRVLKPGGYALMYDLVSDTPEHVMKQAVREFGRLRILLMWLHAFEEPFYTVKDFESLGRHALFRQGTTRFVGALCCLSLRKERHES